MTQPGAETLYHLGRKQGNVARRSKPSGKHTFIIIQNDLTFQSTDDGKSVALPISEHPGALLSSWLLLVLYPSFCRFLHQPLISPSETDASIFTTLMCVRLSPSPFIPQALSRLLGIKKKKKSFLKVWENTGE